MSASGFLTRSAGERGSVTAEFAVLVPAVILLLALCLGGLRLAGDQLRLQDAAGVAARTIARGEGAGLAASRVAKLVDGAAISTVTSGDLVCVRATASGSLGVGILGSLTLAARSCALGGGAESVTGRAESVTGSAESVTGSAARLTGGPERPTGEAVDGGDP